MGTAVLGPPCRLWDLLENVPTSIQRADRDDAFWRSGGGVDVFGNSHSRQDTAVGGNHLDAPDRIGCDALEPEKVHGLS